MSFNLVISLIDSLEMNLFSDLRSNNHGKYFVCSLPFIIYFTIEIEKFDIWLK